MIGEQLEEKTCRARYSEEHGCKTHQAAPGEGKSVLLSVNDSSRSQQSVDLQTVDRLRVSDAAAGGALNVHSKGLSVDQREMGETDEAEFNSSPDDPYLRSVAHGCQLSSSRSLHASQDRAGLNSTA